MLCSNAFSNSQMRDKAQVIRTIQITVLPCGLKLSEMIEFGMLQYLLLCGARFEHFIACLHLIVN